MKNNDILLTDVSKKLYEARELVPNVPYELHDFSDYLASVAGDNDLAPLGMIMLMTLGLEDLKRGQCCFAKKVEFPRGLLEERFEVFVYLSFFPLIIDKIATEEFSKEFRKHFVEIFGNARPPVDENKEIFGVTIVEEGVVDISNKDKAEVLAALYNYSHPQGMSFMHYNPEPMTVEQAREILQETSSFDYLFGRPMKINLTETDAVHTNNYNRDNGEGAAERIISQCRNVK